MKSMTKVMLLSGAMLMMAGPILAAPATRGEMFINRKIKTKVAMPRPALVGAVSAINGSSLTVTDYKQAAYTVDAGQATVSQLPVVAGASYSLADVKVGSRIAVYGTVSGLNVTATGIKLMPVRTNAPMARKGGLKNNYQWLTISAISGNSLTATDSKAVVYTVDATAAKLTKGMGMKATVIALPDLKVGDKIVVIGATAGTNISATQIIDNTGVTWTKPAKQPKTGKSVKMNGRRDY